MNAPHIHRSNAPSYGIILLLFVFAIATVGCNRESDLIAPIVPVVKTDTLDVVAMELSIGGVQLEYHSTREENEQPIPDSTWISTFARVDTFAICDGVGFWKALSGADYAYDCTKSTSVSGYSHTAKSGTARFSIDAGQNRFTSISFRASASGSISGLGSGGSNSSHQTLNLHDVPFGTDSDSSRYFRLDAQGIATHLAAIGDTVALYHYNSVARQSSRHKTNSRRVVRIDADAHIEVRVRVK
ncbi:MAG: hypothetical protein H7X80_02095 [bacterium]|nr:hypothetical protein [Candidatus Kapabacteria bacterium]